MADYLPVASVGGANGNTLVTYGANTAGGTLYQTAIVTGPGCIIEVGGALFVPTAAGGIMRYIPLQSGIGGESGWNNLSYARVPGVSAVLQSSASVTNSVDKSSYAFLLTLPDSYVPNHDIAVTVFCGTTGTGTITPASTTMEVDAYSGSLGVETALSVTVAQQIPSTLTGLVFVVTGAGLTPGATIVLNFRMTVTNSAGTNRGVIYAIGYVA